MLPPNQTYTEHSLLVDQSTLILQPRNGKDYSTDYHRRDRERIALNIHNLRPPFEGL